MNEKSNKLISILSVLDRAQRRACRKFIQSPYFSGNADLLAIFDEVTKRLDRRTTLDKVRIWTAVFGTEKPFSDVRFRKYTSDLFRLLRRFLIQEELDRDENIQNYLYLSSLEQNSPEKLVQGVERNWESIADDSPSFDHHAYLYRHLLEDRKYNLLNYLHRPYDRANIEEISENMDVYFIVVKLRVAIRNQTKIHNHAYNYEINLVPEVINFLNTTGKYLNYPVVALHYYLYKMLGEDNNEHGYYQYKNIILSAPDRLTGDLSTEDFIQPALNYCRRRINEGRREFLSEYLEVYKFGLKHELVFDSSHLDPLQFRNTILTALRLGEYAWAESYIRDYQDRIPEKQRTNAVNYNSATLYFYQKKYDDALVFLRDVEYENTTYNLNSKTMLLAIYYETNEDDVLDSLFDSTIAYLNRHKEIPEINRLAYRNLVTFTRRLTGMLPGDKKAIAQLRADLAEQRYVASRPWLEEKIAEFAGS